MNDEKYESYIGPKGYSIYKENLTIKEQILIRGDLTVKPFAPKTSIVQPKPFLYIVNQTISFIYLECTVLIHLVK